MRVDLPLAATIDTAASGGFRANGVFVGRLVIPANVNQAGVGRVNFVEYVDPPAERLMTVSTQPCDFRGFVAGAPSLTDPTSATYPIKWSNDQTPQLLYQFTAPSSNAVLQAGQTYYVNIRNASWVTGLPSCAGPTCNGRIATTAP